MSKQLNISIASCANCPLNSSKIKGLEGYIEHCIHSNAPRTSWINKKELIDCFPTWCPLEDVK